MEGKPKNGNMSVLKSSVAFQRSEWYTYVLVYMYINMILPTMSMCGYVNVDITTACSYVRIDIRAIRTLGQIVLMSVRTLGQLF